MTTYRASVDLDAPLGQVYAFFAHFADFPRFLDFVEAITYHDRLRSNWVNDIVGQQEWHAVAEEWAVNKEVTWRASGDAQTVGKLMFASLHPDQTRLSVTIASRQTITTDSGELLGAGKYIERALQYDLNQLALTVNQLTATAPAPDLDALLTLMQDDSPANYAEPAHQ